MNKEDVISSIDFFKTIVSAAGNILDGTRSLFDVVVEFTGADEVVDPDPSILYVMNSSDPQTLTIGVDLEDISIGSAITVLRKGVGSVTIIPAEGVTVLKSSATLSISEQYKTVQFLKIAANEWVAIGSFD